jgi:hypothetical protein
MGDTIGAGVEDGAVEDGRPFRLGFLLHPLKVAEDAAMLDALSAKEVAPRLGRRPAPEGTS